MSVEGVPEAMTRRGRLVVVLICVVISVETMLFSILAPVLPDIAHEFGLDSVGAGVVNGAYAVGLVVTAIPAGRLAARIDERWGIIAALVMIGASSIWFAVATHAWELTASRFVAGAASSLVWAGGLAWAAASGPRSTQGTRLATVMSSAIFGTLIGPVLGTLITVTGRTTVFVALGVLSLLLCVPTYLLGRSPEVDPHLEEGLGLLVRNVWPAMAAAFYIGTLMAAVTVMVPLESVARGTSATLVGIVFIIGTLLQAALGPPMGRLTDRLGAPRVLIATLAVIAGLCVALMLAPGALGPMLVLLVLIPAGVGVYTPTMVSVADGAHHLGLATAIAFSAWNLMWALGEGIGSIGGPGLAQLTSNPLVYLLFGVAAAALAVGSRRQGRAQTDSVEKAG